MLGQKLLQSVFKSVSWGAPLLILAMVLATNLQPTLAAEKITFTYGFASHSVSLEELEAFAATGEVSPALGFLLKFSGQNPEVMRWLLTQEVPTNTVVVSKLLNNLVGEYILSQGTNIVHSRSQRGDVKALRGALINSSSDDHRVSLLEFWRKYPTKEVYVDGKSLSNVRHKVSETLEDLEDYAQLSSQLWQKFWE